MVTDDEFSALTNELDAVVQRTIPLVFLPLHHNNPAPIIPILMRILGTIEPEYAVADPVKALSRLIDKAIAQLSDVPLEELGNELSALQLATWLFDVDPDRGSYKTRVAEIRQYCRIFQQKTLQGIITEHVRQPMARILLKLEIATVKPVGAEEYASQADLGQNFLQIKRRTEVESLLRLRNDENRHTNAFCVWGEPGTGKSTLAAQVFNFLQLSPVAVLRAGDPEVLDADITRLLVFEGKRPENWSSSYSLSVFRNLFLQDGSAPGPRTRGIIIDNVDDPEILDALLPQNIRVPIVVTMRKQPRHERLVALELDDFSEQQAITLIQSALPRASDIESLSLARVLGCRPLALDHALRFILEGPRVTIGDVITSLRLDIESGLNQVTHPADKSRNLVRLYELILKSFTTEQNTVSALDAILGIAGKSGILDHDLYDFFMQSPAGGQRDAVMRSAGLRGLFALGLVRSAQEYLLIHPLTYEILRSLRGEGPLLVEMSYLSAISNFNIDWIESEATQEGAAHLPAGWRHAYVRAGRRHSGLLM